MHVEDLRIKNNAKMENGILHEAIRIRSGERQADYGDAVENFRRITALANQLTGLSLTPVQVCKILIALKFTRELHNPKRDNRVDICGYTDILDLLEEDEFKSKIPTGVGVTSLVWKEGRKKKSDKNQESNEEQQTQ